jgi:hypothetical protein
MTATTPIQIDSNSYDRYSLNLAITGSYKADGSPDASIAMRLVPTRIENDLIETADDEAKGIVLGTINGADAATQQAVGAIRVALQTYIQAKGL